MAGKHDGKAAAAQQATNQAAEKESKGVFLNGVANALIRDKQITQKDGTTRDMKSVSFAICKNTFGYQDKKGETPEYIMASVLLFKDQVFAAKSYADPSKTIENRSNVRLVSQNAKNPDKTYNVSVGLPAQYKDKLPLQELGLSADQVDVSKDGQWIQLKKVAPASMAAWKKATDASYKADHPKAKENDGPQADAPEVDAEADFA